MAGKTSENKKPGGAFTPHPVTHMTRFSIPTPLQTPMSHTPTLAPPPVKVLPLIASGESKPSAWKRRGCGICARPLGKFQFKYIGLCGPCRTRTARELGVKVAKIDVYDADAATWYLSTHHTSSI